MLAAVSQTLKYEGPLHGPERWDMGHGREANPSVTGRSQVGFLRESQMKLVTYCTPLNSLICYVESECGPLTSAQQLRLLETDNTDLPYLTKRQGWL